MAAFEDIAGLSPLPVVDLNDIKPPTSGALVPVSSVCLRNFLKDGTCRKHYEKLADTGKFDGKIVQCPYGFATCALPTKTLHLAFTGVIPYPRIGGANEREVSKNNKHAKVPIQTLLDAAAPIINAEIKFDALAKDHIDNQSVALHEVRKLNRNVKQAAERLCLSESPNDPDGADPQLVAIWKSSELMSWQFEVIELLADNNLVRIPPNSTMEIYKVFDKCARIFRHAGRSSSIILHAPYDYRSKVATFDKTFSIIPTALIENALKYVLPGSAVDIEFHDFHESCVVHVKNLYRGNHQLSAAVFHKGVRFTANREGSGNGLFLAKLVAQQHRATLDVATKPIRQDTMECTFTLVMPRVA